MQLFMNNMKINSSTNLYTLKQKLILVGNINFKALTIYML